MNLERMVIVCCSAATVGTGLAGGIFFAFSSFVMRALGAVPPRAGIAAMNAINVAVINPGFMLVFLGTALLSIALAFASSRFHHPPDHRPGAAGWRVGQPRAGRRCLGGKRCFSGLDLGTAGACTAEEELSLP